MPAPDPVPSTPPAPAAPAIAGAVPGQTLTGSQACAEGDFSYTGSPPRLANIDTITGLSVTNGRPGNGVDIGYVGLDSYNVTLGFDYGGGLLTPSNKIAPQTTAFDAFNAGGFEFDIYRNVGAQSLRQVTLARHGSAIPGNASIDGYTCFLAAGLASASLPSSGVTSFAGIADGIALLGGRAARLFGSSATLSIDYAQRTGTVRIDLAGREPPFAEFVGATTTPIGTATAQFNLAPGSGYFDDAPLIGPNGSTGTITGQVHGAGAAAGLAFELRFANGDRMFGAVAVERP